jgi:predicted anti-sigma-YlaC factor YlaD
MQFKTFCKMEMDCSCREKFSEYLDGMLSEEERISVHEHLKECDECSDELDRLCKTISILVESREECLPQSIRNFRLPRSTFVEIFPTIREEPAARSISTWAPYVYALILFFLMVSSWEFAYRHTFEKFYNASNYVEVVAKI